MPVSGVTAESSCAVRWHFAVSTALRVPCEWKSKVVCWIIVQCPFFFFGIGRAGPWRQGIDRTSSLLISSKKKQLAYWHEKLVPSPMSVALS